jgi:hypothetical protein
VLTHLVSDGEVRFLLLQLLTASLVLQHGAHRLFHSETKEVYKVTNEVSTANLERYKERNRYNALPQIHKSDSNSHASSQRFFHSAMYKKK